MTEREAIARLKHGDISGLEILVRSYQKRATQAAYLIVRDWAAAEDIAQAAFLRAYEHIDQFDAARPFGPWFLRSVVNSALMFLEREKRQVPLETPERSFEELLVAPDLTDDADMRHVVWAALEQLSAPQRAAIVLRYFLDLSEDEMAERLNVPSGTVKWRLHAARKRLRTLLRPL